MKGPKNQTIDVLAELDAIKDRVDELNNLAVWAILANMRFAMGDRVTFSPRAIREGMNKRRKSQYGTVLEVTDHFSIKVQMDGVKRPSTWHHAFFQLMETK
jgi:hypothetical protein